MENLFKSANEYYAREYSRTQEIQEILREMDEHIRSLQTHFMKIHGSGYDVERICSVGQQLIEETCPVFAALDKLFTRAEFYKYSQMWQFRVSSFLSLCLLNHWLQADHLRAIAQESQSEGEEPAESDLLLPFETLERNLGLHKLPNFHITLEDYLFALTNLSSELGRLATNAVTRQDWRQPQRIADFLNDLYAGLRQMSLKNDSLRRRFDGVKYDVKKVEDILYDLSVRDLLQRKEDASE